MSTVTCTVGVTFTVDGRSYSGDLDVHFIKPGRDGHHDAYRCRVRSEEAVDDYAVGDTVPVAYDPRDPTDFGRPSTPHHAWVILVLGTAITLLGVVGAFRLGRRSAWSATRAGGSRPGIGG